MSGKTQYAQTERVLRILHALYTEGILSMGQLSDRISRIKKGTSERTIYRDLDFLVSMGYVIRNPGTKGYLLSHILRFPFSIELLKDTMKSK